jgi:hypothetical protein
MLSRFLPKRTTVDSSAPAEEEAKRARAYEVGWLFNSDKTSLIWGAPQPVHRSKPDRPSLADYDHA